MGIEIAERFDLPAEALAGIPKLTLTGTSRAHVENHKGLLGYSAECIVVSGGRVRLRLVGANLELRAMDMGDLVVTGDIHAVELE